MKRALFIRTVVFGVTDSLVSTVGLLAGIDVAGVAHGAVVLTGVIYAFVEAFSMAVGNYLSDESAEEYAQKADVPDGPALAAALLMFIVFAVASFIPLAPYLFLSGRLALPASIAVSLLALFATGAWGARLARLPAAGRGWRMAVLGGAAILMGVVIGTLVPGV